MKAYLDLLKHVLENGESHDDRTGVGTLSCFDGYTFRHDMSQGFPLLTTKKLPFRWIAEELFWFLRGSTNEHELRAVGVDIWREWATLEQCAKFGRDQGDLGPIYGYLWRNFGGDYKRRFESDFQGTTIEQIEAFKAGYRTPCRGIDQIALLLKGIEELPNSRRHIVSGWDPRECDNVALPPCHTLWQIKIHPEKYMSLHLYARSIDSFLGLPFNIASYGLLLSLLAAVTGYKPRNLIISFGDLHVYKNHIEQVKIQLDREPRPLPLFGLKDLGFIRGKYPADVSSLDRLLSVKYEHLELIGYEPHPKISAEVAI